LFHGASAVADARRAEARQGEIILRIKARQIIFIAGLIGVVVLAALLQLASVN
jgi:hypothetical protein